MDKSIENGMIVGAERHDPQCQDVECSRCDTCDQWVPDTEIAVLAMATGCATIAYMIIWRARVRTSCQSISSKMRLIFGSIGYLPMRTERSSSEW